ncbi:MAG: MGMT family protein [Patescibacteria group bacterium]
MEKTVPNQHTRRDALFQLLLEIPKGSFTTYGELARTLGTSPRAVASMLASNTEQDIYPCYKVVASDGRASGYNLGTEEKLRRLAADGVFVDGGKVDITLTYRFLHP